MGVAYKILWVAPALCKIERNIRLIVEGERQQIAAQTADAPAAVKPVIIKQRNKRKGNKNPMIIPVITNIRILIS